MLPSGQTPRLQQNTIGLKKIHPTEEKRDRQNRILKGFSENSFLENILKASAFSLEAF